MMLILMKMILKLLFASYLWVGTINLYKLNHLKKLSKELLLVAWHPTRWWDQCMTEDEEKRIEPVFIDKY